MLNREKIRARLAEMNLTQKTVAEVMRLSPATVSQKLSGARPLSLDEAEKLAEILSIKDE